MFTNNAVPLKLSSFFTAENLVINKERQELADVHSVLLNNLALTYGIGNVKQIYSEHHRRNGNSPPQLINKIALVQHYRVSTTESLRMAIAINRETIKHDFKDDNLALHLLILIVTPKTRPDLYLRVYSSLSKLLEEKSFINELISLNDAEAAWGLLEQKAVQIPSHIDASDIMLELGVVIHEDKNLQDAIDMFVQNNLIYIPVVDKFGDIMGEVTLKELMNVCLPRYILWLDDISPVLNFESFTNLLQNEDNTWLNEIMHNDVAKVQFNEPALNAAIKMTKLEVNHCYVLKENKLIGIIPMQHFVYRALRE